MSQGSPIGGIYSGPGVSINATGEFVFDPASDDVDAGDNVEITYSLALEGALELVGNELLGDTGDGFGTDAAINGDGTRIIVGAPLNSDVELRSGKVSVYELSADESTWIPLGSPLLGVDELNNYGNRVEINTAGDRIFIPLLKMMALCKRLS